MSAPPQGSGGGGSGLSPATFLGTYTGTNPSNPANGYWWYRADLGQIWMNVNGTIMPVGGTGSVSIIATSVTIANTDVYNDIIVVSGATLTIYGTVIFHGNVTILNGGTLQSSNPNASSSSPATNNYQFLGNFYLNGTYTIAQYNVDNINNSTTINKVTAAGGASPTISGAGTLSIPSGVTLTVNANATWSIPAISGSGTLSVASGYTITINGNTTISVSTTTISATVAINSGYTLTIATNATLNGSVSGVGTLSVSSGYTLTVSANVTWSIPTISGSGTISVASGYTLTQGAAMTISIANISVAGTWANAGYGITIPSGATVSWKTTGSLTTASTAGTLTINGTLYYYGISLTANSSSSGDPGLPSFPLTLAGTGIGLFTTSNTSSGGNSVSFSNLTLSAGSNSSNGVSTVSGIYSRLTLTSISGSVVGKYGLEAYVSGYYQLVLVYIGTANTTYSVNFTGVAGTISTSGYTAYLRNSSASAGSITVTGTLYD